jgi:hypothetical protein
MWWEYKGLTWELWFSVSQWLMRLNSLKGRGILLGGTHSLEFHNTQYYLLFLSYVCVEACICVTYLNLILKVTYISYLKILNEIIIYLSQNVWENRQHNYIYISADPNK